MGITTRAVNAAEFTQESIGDAKVVYLLDVPAVSPAARDALVALVRSGGGLVLVPGPMTETGSYNTIIRSGFEPVLPAMAREHRR
ncbi:MAG: hypothetical protein U5N86_11740 [Planctomycetota bacterium]|nr:hypothetical protein [Planctomycetota bacterium]